MKFVFGDILSLVNEFTVVVEVTELVVDVVVIVEVVVEPEVSIFVDEIVFDMSE